MFRAVLIANRGEIAIRIIRACRDLDVRAVAVYSDADRDALHVRLADEAYHIGDAPPASSYLNIERIVETARQAGAEAIHPGYGFLAENASFAKACEDAGITFVGPGAEAIERMGDKVAARKTAEAAGAPIVPGTIDPVSSPEEIEAFASEHGFPFAIKASFGGGGRGFKVVRDETELRDALEGAQREAKLAFGRDEVYVERYLAGARHVESQILADRHGTVLFFGERDCSMQRRHQKLIEETPSPAVSPEVRERIRDASVAIAREVGYVNAGTVEYLLDANKRDFYFMEMNTRLQVEHPVTEMVTGVDLAAWQIRVAAGERLRWRQEEIPFSGHAIECRINAEDPGKRFFPAPGWIGRYREPQGPGVRVDGGFEAGSEIPRAYDSLIAKVVTWGRDRDEARRRMLRALAEYEVEGVKTTIPFHQMAMADERFIAGEIHTAFVETEMDLSSLKIPPVKKRAGRPAEEPREVIVEVEGKRLAARVYGLEPDGGAPAATGPAKPQPPVAEKVVSAGGGGAEVVSAPMQGTIVKTAVAEGQSVKAGDLLVVLEAMKMENHINAPRDGVVAELKVQPGQNIETGATLAVLE